MSAGGKRAPKAGPTAFYLSLDASLDEGDHLLGREVEGRVVKAEHQRAGKLAPGQSYVATALVTIPFEVKGGMHVIAYADSGLADSGWAKSTISSRLVGVRGSAEGRVEEFQGEGNNATEKAVEIVAYTAPNLQVTALAAPERAVRGQKFEVSYTVTNNGGATPALQSGWDDLVYLSRDPFLDLAADRFMGTVTPYGWATRRRKLHGKA
jgi:hypothetical protein